MSIRSSLLGSRLYARLESHLERFTSGTAVCEALLIFDAVRDLRRRPDVAFVSKERWPLDKPIPVVGDWAVIPDVAVEVLSPNDVAADLFGKIKEYFSFNVRQVWLVLPDDSKIYVYTSPLQVRILGVHDELDGGELIPGFRLKLSELFKNPQVAVDA